MKSIFMRVAAVLLIMFISVPLFSCTAVNTDPFRSDAEASDPSVVYLNYYVWTDEALYASKAIDAFNILHKDIHISLITLKADNYENSLQQILNDPSKQIDLFGTKGIANTIQLVDDQQMYDMTHLVESSITDDSITIPCYGNMFNEITYNHSYYVMPTRTTCWALYYNKDLFDQAGLPYPEQLTWEEYRELAKSLTSGSGSTKVWGGYFVPWLPNFLALQYGSYLTDDDQQYARESIELLNSFYTDQSHLSYKNIQLSEDSSTDVYTKFKAGRVAMVPQGEWMVNVLLEDNTTTVNWDIAPMPIKDDMDPGTTFGQYQFIGISSSCEYPEEAFEFIKFLTGKNGATIYAQNAIIPAYTDSEIISIYQNAVNKESAKYFFEAKKYSEQIAISGYKDVMTSFSTNAENYFAGKVSLDEAMQQFEEERREIYHT